jgi:hypothetical protein
MAEPSFQQRLEASIMRLALIQIKQAKFGRRISWLVQFQQIH